MTSFFDNRVPFTGKVLFKDAARQPTFKWLLDAGQLIDGAIMTGAWEWHTTWAVEHFVKPGMHVLDVGANMGYYSVLLSYLVEDAGRVVAFEPMEEPCALARLHCALNGYLEPHTTVLQVALAARDGVDGKLFNYSWPPNRCQQTPSKFNETRLDTFFPSLHWPSLDAIKLDVDGYELRVIEGGLETLRAQRPLLFLEVCDYTLRDTEGLGGANYCYGTQVLKMLSMLDALGYKHYREETLEPMTDAAALIASVDLSRQSINLICCARGETP